MSAPLEGAQATVAHISCVVLDDHPAILDSVGRVLDHAGFQVVCLTSRPAEALRAIESEQPDVALVDIRLGEVNGLELARRICRSASRTAIVVYTAFADRALLMEALDAGARGFVLKDAPLAELIRAIENVCRGQTYVDGSLVHTLASGADEPGAALTQREREVLRLLADGLSTEEISKQMFVSPATVKVHLVKAMRKLNAATRTQAVATALRQAIIS